MLTQRLPHPRPPRDRGTGAAQAKPRAARWVAPHPLCSPPRPQCPPGVPGPAPLPPPSVSDTGAAAGKGETSARPGPVPRSTSGSGTPPPAVPRSLGAGQEPPARTATARDSPFHCAQRAESYAAPLPVRPAPGPRRARIPLSGRAAAAELLVRGVQARARRLPPGKFLLPKEGRRAFPAGGPEPTRRSPPRPHCALLHRWALPPRCPGFLVAVDVCLARPTPQRVRVLPSYGFLMVKGTFHDVFQRIAPNRMN